jgi:hypothetical protein
MAILLYLLFLMQHCAQHQRNADPKEFCLHVISAQNGLVRPWLPCDKDGGDACSTVGETEIFSWKLNKN